MPCALLFPDRVSEGLEPVKHFGDALISTRDLDPLYCGLVHVGLPQPQWARFVLAYLMFYHVGVASYLSELDGVGFWRGVAGAAENIRSPGDVDNDLPEGRWPRGTERRHFRGPRCVLAVQRLAEMFPRPQDAVEGLLLASDVLQLIQQVKQWPMFGPWVAFKAADIIGRTLPDPGRKRFRMGTDLVLMYDSPRAALNLVASTGAIQEVWYELLTHFETYPAPPWLERGCGPEEVETVLCKYGSMKTGHYYVGKDIAEQRHHLHGWGVTAAKLLSCYPGLVT